MAGGMCESATGGWVSRRVKKSGCGTSGAGDADVWAGGGGGDGGRCEEPRQA